MPPARMIPGWADAVPARDLDAKTWRLGLLAVLLLAAGLRLAGLEVQSLWLNELDSWWISQQDSVLNVLTRAVIEDFHPPGYQLLLFGVIHSLGDSEFLLRLPSVLTGVLAVYFMALLGRQLFDARTGLLAALLLACLWAPVYYSQEARSYGTLMMAAILSTHCLCRVMAPALRGAAPSWPARVLYVLTAALTAYLHYFGLLVVAVHGVLLLLCLGITRLSVGLMAAVALAYLPWLPGMWQDLQVREHWIRRPGLHSWPVFYAFAFNRSFALALLVALPLHAWVALRALGGLVRDRERLAAWLRRPEVLLAVWILLPTTIAFAKSLLSTAVWSDRNLIICVPPLVLLAAHGLRTLPVGALLSRVLAVTVPAVFLAHMVWVMDYYSLPTKEDFRGAVAHVIDRNRVRAAPVVGVRFPYYYDYYFEHFGSPTRTGLTVLTASDAERLDRFAHNAPAGRFWLVHGRFFPLEADLKQHLDQHYQLIEERRFTGSRAALYQLQPAKDDTP